MSALVLPLTRCFQLGYVTRSFDSGVAAARERFGIDDFKFMRDLSGHSRHIALAYVGGIMVEVVEPQDPVNGIYAAALPVEEGAMALHHLGYLIDTDSGWDAMRRAVLHYAGGVAAEGEFGETLRFLYADTRALLGHFVEYIQLGVQGREMFASVPGNRKAVTL